SLLVARLFDAAISQPSGEAAKIIRRAACALGVTGAGLAAILTVNATAPEFLKGFFRNSREFDRIARALPAVLSIAAVLAVVAFAAYVSRRPLIALAAF